MTAIYCTAANVERVFQNTFSFTSGSTPNKTDVDNTIEEMQDEIDHTTQHAWRNIQVTDEYYDLPLYPYGHGYNYDVGIAINMRHRKIKSLSSAAGDKIEVWNGSTYDDWLTDKTEGRADDFWLEPEQGILHLKYYYPYYRKKAVRLSYRYGETTVPLDIQRACSMMVAIVFLQNDDKTAMLNETGSTNLEYINRINQMQKQIDRILNRRMEISVI